MKTEDQRRGLKIFKKTTDESNIKPMAQLIIVIDCKILKLFDC